MRATRTCPQTGLDIPECSCRRCCEALLRRFAPELGGSANAAAPPFAGAVVCSIEDYAHAEGISVAELKRRARTQEVRL